MKEQDIDGKGVIDTQKERERQKDHMNRQKKEENEREGRETRKLCVGIDENGSLLVLWTNDGTEAAVVVVRAGS